MEKKDPFVEAIAKEYRELSPRELEICIENDPEPGYKKLSRKTGKPESGTTANNVASQASGSGKGVKRSADIEAGDCPLCEKEFECEAPQKEI